MNHQNQQYYYPTHTPEEVKTNSLIQEFINAKHCQLNAQYNCSADQYGRFKCDSNQDYNTEVEEIIFSIVHVNHGQFDNIVDMMHEIDTKFHCDMQYDLNNLLIAIKNHSTLLFDCETQDLDRGFFTQNIKYINDLASTIDSEYDTQLISLAHDVINDFIHYYPCLLDLNSDINHA